MRQGTLRRHCQIYARSPRGETLMKLRVFCTTWLLCLRSMMSAYRSHNGKEECTEKMAQSYKVMAGIMIFVCQSGGIVSPLISIVYACSFLYIQPHAHSVSNWNPHTCSQSFAQIFSRQAEEEVFGYSLQSNSVLFLVELHLCPPSFVLSLLKGCLWRCLSDHRKLTSYWLQPQPISCFPANFTSSDPTESQRNPCLLPCSKASISVFQLFICYSAKTGPLCNAIYTQNY